jgi:hypothetical protein
MTKPSVIAALLCGMLAAGSAIADDDDDVQPRFSPSVGIGVIRALSGRSDISRSWQPAATLDLTLELGSVFLAGSAHLSPDDVFVGVRVGYALGNEIISPYGSAGVGFMSQTAQSQQGTGPDASVTLDGSGLGFAFEAGIVFLRRPGLGRVWLFGFALLPTFNLQSGNQPAPNIPAGGFGIRLGL